jgi:hypothetical protein
MRKVTVVFEIEDEEAFREVYGRHLEGDLLCGAFPILIAVGDVVTGAIEIIESVADLDAASTVGEVSTLAHEASLYMDRVNAFD